MKNFTFEQFLAKYKEFQKQYDIENPWMESICSLSLEYKAEKLYNYHLRRSSLPKWMK